MNVLKFNSLRRWWISVCRLHEMHFNFYRNKKKKKKTTWTFSYGISGRRDVQLRDYILVFWLFWFCSFDAKLVCTRALPTDFCHVSSCIHDFFFLILFSMEKLQARNRFIILFTIFTQDVNANKWFSLFLSSYARKYMYCVCNANIFATTKCNVKHIYSSALFDERNAKTKKKKTNREIVWKIIIFFRHETATYTLANMTRFRRLCTQDVKRHKRAKTNWFTFTRFEFIAKPTE